MTNKTDAEILADAPELDDLVTDITGAYFDCCGNYLTPRGVWGQSYASPVHPRSLADITELVELRKKNAELESHNLGLTKTLVEFEKDIAFLQSCVNSGEAATPQDRPSERAKQLKDHSDA